MGIGTRPADERAEATVLVVDDDPKVVETHASFLDAYDVRTATGGQAAVETVEKAGETIDVVLLDRRMPGLSGDDVLDRIEASDADPHVVMVTAVDPDLDIVDMPFDGYLTKPVGRDGLVGAVERMLDRRAYAEATQRRLAVAEKLATLESECSRDTAELAESDRYQRLSDRLEATQEVAVETMATLPEGSRHKAFDEI